MQEDKCREKNDWMGQERERQVLKDSETCFCGYALRTRERLIAWRKNACSEKKEMKKYRDVVEWLFNGCEIPRKTDTRQGYSLTHQRQEWAWPWCLQYCSSRPWMAFYYHLGGYLKQGFLNGQCLSKMCTWLIIKFTDLLIRFGCLILSSMPSSFLPRVK